MVDTNTPEGVLKISELDYRARIVRVEDEDDRYACPVCFGAKYVRRERSPSDWVGKLYACSRCSSGLQVELGQKAK